MLHILLETYTPCFTFIFFIFLEYVGAETIDKKMEAETMTSPWSDEYEVEMNEPEVNEIRDWVQRLCHLSQNQ